MNWYVLYTKSRSEKSVANKLSLAGIEVYCPQVRRRKLWSDRVKWIEEPLFRSYCFVYIDDRQRDRVFTVPGVVRYLYHCGHPAIVRHSEMEILKSWLMKYSHENMEAYSLSTNDLIKIKSGAFIDKEARVLESKGNYAVLYLEYLGLQVKVDLRKNIIEKLRVC